MKDPDYLMNMMENWTTVDHFEGVKTIKDYMESSVT